MSISELCPNFFADRELWRGSRFRSHGDRIGFELRQIMQTYTPHHGTLDTQQDIAWAISPLFLRLFGPWYVLKSEVE